MPCVREWFILGKNKVHRVLQSRSGTELFVVGVVASG